MLSAINSQDQLNRAEQNRIKTFIITLWRITLKVFYNSAALKLKMEEIKKLNEIKIMQLSKYHANRVANNMNLR